MMVIKDQSKVWDNIASKWNEFRDVPSPTVINFLKNASGNLLDAGCGSGRNFRAVNSKTKLYGVDFSQKMLTLAKANSKKLNLKSVLKKSSVSSLPFKGGFFDYTICVAVLHCVSSKKERIKILKELYRVSKNNSSTLISVWSKNSPRLRGKPKECFIPWTVQSNNPNRLKEKAVKQERYTYIYDLEEIKKQVISVGFKIEKIWEERNINIIARKV